MTTALVDAAAEMETVAVSHEGGGPDVLTVVLSRPESRNSMNQQLRTELIDLLDAVDDSAAKVVVITGDEAGRAFAAGADVTEFQRRDFLEQREMSAPPRVYETVAELRQPVIARINGHALGGGLELALASDIRIAREDAKLGQPEINIGVMPGGGASQRLPRLVGEGKAMELTLTGDPISGEEGERIGLVNHAVPADELDDEVYGMADSIAEHSTVAIEYTKRACKAASSLPLEQGLDYERELFAGLFATGEKDEGISAFFEDRDPEWRY